MSGEKTGVVIAIGFLAAFFAVQGWLLARATHTVATVREPIFASSTHSLLYPETGPASALDGHAETFWWDSGRLVADPRLPTVLLPYEGLYLTFQAGLTHRPGRPPQPLHLSQLGIRAGAPGALRQEYARPRRIRLSYFEQQLYHINHDYRFPDQPVFVAGREFSLADSADEQLLSLAFVPQPRESSGFPDQVKARWFRIEILDVFAGSRPDVAIREVRAIADSARSEGERR